MEAQHLVDETLGVAQRLPAVLGVVVVADEPGYVAAGAEGGTGTGEHDGPGVAVARDLVPDVAHRLVERVDEGVPHVRVVHGDDPDRAVRLHDELLGYVVHRRDPLVVQARSSRCRPSMTDT